PAQIVVRHRLDDGQRRRRRVVMSVSGRRRVCVGAVRVALALRVPWSAVDAERLQTSAEDAAEIALQRAHRFRDSHASLYVRGRNTECAAADGLVRALVLSLSKDEPSCSWFDKLTTSGSTSSPR